MDATNAWRELEQARVQLEQARGSLGRAIRDLDDPLRSAAADTDADVQHTERRLRRLLEHIRLRARVGA
jgi:uncharacterized protein YgfB (UPF0149 family)